MVYPNVDLLSLWLAELIKLGIGLAQTLLSSKDTSNWLSNASRTIKGPPSTSLDLHTARCKSHLCSTKVRQDKLPLKA